MQPLHVDTHVLAWLYQGERARFPEKAQQSLEAYRLSCSPMSILELDYLYEIGRLKVTGATIVRYLQERISLSVSSAAFAEIVSEAHKLTWTRDPFDRIIVATASLTSTPLLTKDTHLRTHYSRSVWD